MNWDQVAANIIDSADVYFKSGAERKNPDFTLADYTIGSVLFEIGKALHEGCEDARTNTTNNAPKRDGNIVDLQRP